MDMDLLAGRPDSGGGGYRCDSHSITVVMGLAARKLVGESLSGPRHRTRARSVVWLFAAREFRSSLTASGSEDRKMRIAQMGRLEFTLHPRSRPGSEKR